MRSAEGVTGVAAADCNSQSCQEPLRAGVKIQDGATEGSGTGASCSAGFIGRWWSGSQYIFYVMTAGHCIDGTTADRWRAREPWLQQSYAIGYVGSWRFGNEGNVLSGLQRDIAIIQMTPGYHWASPVANWLWMKGWSPTAERWPVSGQGAPYQGRYGCRTGFVSNHTCGSIAEANASRTIRDHDGSMHPIENVIRVPGACPMGGDSGGPFIDGGTAVGITVAGSPDAAPNCTEGWFQHVNDIGNWLGVSVYTG